MLVIDALKILPPNIHLWVLEGYGVNSVPLHQGMRRLSAAMYVEFFFQERVDGTIKVERKAGRPGGPEPVIDIKTPRAIHEKPDFRARESPLIAAVIPIRPSVGFIILAH